MARRAWYCQRCGETLAVVEPADDAILFDRVEIVPTSWERVKVDLQRSIVMTRCRCEAERTFSPRLPLIIVSEIPAASW